MGFGDFFVCWMVGYEIFGSGELTFSGFRVTWFLGARASCPENRFFLEVFVIYCFWTNISYKL